jgi:hypothetical protein
MNSKDGCPECRGGGLIPAIGCSCGGNTHTCASRQVVWPRLSSRILAPLLRAGGSSARGCEVVGALLQEGFELVTDHLIPWDERAVAGVELLEEVVGGRALCLFDEFGDVDQLQVAEAARG